MPLISQKERGAHPYRVATNSKKKKWCATIQGCNKKKIYSEQPNKVAAKSKKNKTTSVQPNKVATKK